MRSQAITVTLTDLGAGRVVLNQPPESLLPKGETFISAPASPDTRNCRLQSGLVTARYGYSAFGTTPTVSSPARVLDLFTALFDNGTTKLVRADAGGLRYYNAGTWTNIITSQHGQAGSLTGLAMVRDAGGSPGNQLFYCSGEDSDPVKYVRSDMSSTASIGNSFFLGVKSIVGHRGRALLANVYDVGANLRKHQRVYYSIVGDPETHTGTGSGFVDLDDDTFPIVRSQVIGGNVIQFKGDVTGGAIVVGTQTGSVNAPYRWDTLNTNNVGIKCPRTLVSLSAGLCFFVGHDGFYLYDGARGLLPVVDEVTRDILPRINQNALNSAFSYYRPETYEIYTFLPMGSTTYPTEGWVFNLRERRCYGPLLPAHGLTAAAAFTGISIVTYANAVGTYANNPYTTYAALPIIAGSKTYIFGDSDGNTWQDEVIARTDAGASFAVRYTSPVIRAEGLKDAQGRLLTASDMLSLHDFTFMFKNIGAWTPTVEVCLNGTSWTNISDAVAVGSNTLQLNRIKSRTYSTLLTSSWFQARVTGDAKMALSGMRFEFTPGGSEQAYE